MFSNFEDLQKISKVQLDAAAATAASFSRGWQEIAGEWTDFSRKSLEESSVLVENLLGAKTLESALQLQSDFARNSYEGFVSRSTRMGELYARLLKEAFKPVETALRQSSHKGSSKGA